MTEAKNAEAELARTETVQFGLKNAYGQFWTTDTFNTPEAAAKHWNAFWSLPGFKGTPPHDPIIVCCLLTLVELAPQPVKGQP